MTHHTVTVYRHRTCHTTPSQYTDTGHATTHRHSIQTQDMPHYPVTIYRHRANLFVISIDVERNTGIHNYPFYVLVLTRLENPFRTPPPHTHTHAHSHTHTHIYTRTHIHSHTHSHTRTLTHIHTRILTHSHTHTHTHTHAHT